MFSPKSSDLNFIWPVINLKYFTLIHFYFAQKYKLWIFLVQRERPFDQQTGTSWHGRLTLDDPLINFILGCRFCNSFMSPHGHFQNMKQLSKYLFHDLVNSSFMSLPYFSPIIGLMSRVFANGLGDQVSILGRVIPKTQKMVLDAVLINTQHYMVKDQE